MRKYEHFEFDFPLIAEAPDPGLQIVAVIPAFREDKLDATLDSLIDAARTFPMNIEIIVVINDSEVTPAGLVEFHDLQFITLLSRVYSDKPSSVYIHPIRLRKQPVKHAGVGLARKVGMDEACRRFSTIRNPEGIIASLDGDVTVEANYFREIHLAYKKDPTLRAAVVGFEHPLEEAPNAAAREAIVQYESHLRYYVAMQRLLKLPYAYHTVGSTMTVRTEAYLAHFGMNRRKAGEDFYFLQKFIKTGFFRSIPETTVYPSARFSDRVPFGTGTMISKLAEGNQQLHTYHPDSFFVLQSLLNGLDSIYADPLSAEELIPQEVRAFAGELFIQKIREAHKHTAGEEAFKKRFFRWFDGFQLMKYLHFCRVRFYPDIPVDLAVSRLFSHLQLPLEGTPEEKLRALRKLDRDVRH